MNISDIVKAGTENQCVRGGLPLNSFFDCWLRCL